jgi:hypothetical protein
MDMARRGSVLKVAIVNLDQASWLESEAEKIGVSQAELIRQAIERLRAGPPARRPVDRRCWWRSREWLEQMAEEQRRAKENWRYRLGMRENRDDDAYDL